MKTQQHIVAPPWKLSGHGTILIYNLSLQNQQKILNKSWAIGGLSVLMLVRYKNTPIGPYEEWLLIPGQIKTDNKTGYHISHIHVSTDISTVNGRHHWAIPKITSDFEWKESGNMHSAVIMDPENRSTHIKVKGSKISIPVFTHWLPYRIIQQSNAQWCSIRPTAWGRAQMAKLNGFESNMEGFEHFNGKKPLLCVNVPLFNMKFPIGDWSA